MNVIGSSNFGPNLAYGQTATLFLVSLTGLALLFLRQDWRRILLPFAAVGRMALTDYLMQSVLCTVFFYHYTTGLHGRIGPAIGLVPGVWKPVCTGALLPLAGIVSAALPA